MEEVLEPKKDKTERATQTFFRVTFMNNCNLLQIADNKANIVISINALVISSLVAIIRPKFLGRRKNNEEEVKSSMMFFGVSSNFTLQEYLTELDEILPSKKQVQEQMAISLYYQGKVLNRKYKLLAHAYTVFIIGLAIGVVTFFIYLIAL